MNIRLSIAVRNARLQAVADAMDAGGASGTLTLYSGTQPVQAGAPLDQENTELVVLTCPKPFASDIANGVMTIGSMGQEMATGDGLATWGRFRDSAGAFVADADAGDQESDALITISNPLIYAGALISVGSAQLAEG